MCEKMDKIRKEVESGGRELCMLLDISGLGEAGEEQAWIMNGASAKLQVLLNSSQES